jgi:hypothetical protein
VRSLVRKLIPYSKLVISSKYFLLKVLGLFIISIFTILFTIIFNNRKQVYPSTFERKLLDDFFQIQEIKNEKDIIYVQNMAISKIAHYNTGDGQLSTIKTLSLKKGLCYDRSLLLQKFFLMKGFRIRPIYLFWGNRNTTFLDLFNSSTPSHSVFEIYYRDNWYLIMTNKKMTRLEGLSLYLNSGSLVPKHSKYLRYLNNRNGRFLYPSFVPDIYLF